MLPIAKVRELVARAYVSTGGMVDPIRDVDAAVENVRKRGIENTPVLFLGEKVTTRMGIEEELETVRIARALHREGRLSAMIGSAGAGKSTHLAQKAEVWRSEGRQVWGAALAWRQVSELPTDEKHRAALVPALERIERGNWDVRRRDVIVVDEVGLLGSRDLLRVLRAAEAKGADVYLAGDPKQTRSPSAGDPLKLLEMAGVELPEHLDNFRQRTERHKEIAANWRAGEVETALEKMREDRDLVIAPGGRQTVLDRIAEHHDKLGLIMTGSNAEAREIGEAIRAKRQADGLIGRNLHVVEATDRTERYALPLAEGDRVRLFDRVLVPGSRQHLGNNGDVLTVRTADARGVTMENATGAVGTVPWAKLQRPETGDAVRLAPGYASTIHTAQGASVEAATLVALNGTSSLDLPRTYTAMTRHRGEVQLVVNGEAEREIALRRMPLGSREPVDLNRQLAQNLGRVDKRELATEAANQFAAGRETMRNDFQRAADRAADLHKGNRAAIYRHYGLRMGR